MSPVPLDEVGILLLEMSVRRALMFGRPPANSRGQGGATPLDQGVQRAAEVGRHRDRTEDL